MQFDVSRQVELRLFLQIGHVIALWIRYESFFVHVEIVSIALILILPGSYFSHAYVSAEWIRDRAFEISESVVH